MSYIQTLLFENPWWLGAFSFLLFAVVLFLRRRWTGNAARYSLPATLAGIALLFLVQSLVTTQRESIRHTLEQFVASIEHQDAVALEAVFSSSYDSEGMNRQAVAACIDSYLKYLAIQDTRFRRLDVTVDGDRARMVLSAYATVSIRGAIGEFHTGRWQIDWIREGEEWRITALRPEVVDGIEINSLQALRGYVP